MTAEELDKALADDAGGAENTSAKFSWKFGERSRLLELWGGTHASPLRLELWLTLKDPGENSIPGAPAALRSVEGFLSKVESEAQAGAGPMRVPRTCGLKVLRTQTTISVSAARGSTFAWRTFAPLAARARASS